MQPRVARNELPWVRRGKIVNPERVASDLAIAISDCASVQPGPVFDRWIIL